MLCCRRWLRSGERRYEIRASSALCCVVAEALGEERECFLGAVAGVARQPPSVRRAGLEPLADVGDQRAVDADQRIGDDLRAQVAWASAGLVREHLREGVGVAR